MGGRLVAMVTGGVAMVIEGEVVPMVTGSVIKWFP